MLDALESDAGGDGADASREPEPYCATCADVGIFLRFGLDWQHYRSGGTTAGQVGLFAPLAAAP